MNRRSSLGVAAALWLTVSALSFPEAAGQNPARPADVPAPEPVPRAVLDRYCVTCHNSRAKSGGLVLEKIDLSDVGAHSDTVGEGRAQGARRHDAPARHAGPAGRGQAGAARLAHVAARPRGPGVAPARPPARPSSEPRRVRQRHPRPAGPRDRPGSAAAGRRFERRLRQHRRRAGPVSRAARELSLGGRPHQRARDRRPEDAADGRGLSRAPGRVAVAARRRAAARDGGRVRDHAQHPARRRVRVPGEAVPHQPRDDARARVPASARDQRRRPAGAPGLVWRRQRRPRVERQPDDHGRRDR